MTLEERMQTYSVQTEGDSRPIAPWWHSGLLLAQLLVLCLIGPASARLRLNQPHLTLYVAAITSQWLQLSAAVAGVYRRRQFFADALQCGKGTWRSEIGLGVLMYIALIVLYGLLTIAMRIMGYRPHFDHEIIRAMAPASLLELLLWLCVSLVVGFCEELVFRGYLLRQVLAWWRAKGASPHLAKGLSVLFTSILFGSLHLYEGLGGAILIVMLAIVYSMVALSRGNLRAVIVAHVLQDFVAMAVIMLKQTHRA